MDQREERDVQALVDETLEKYRRYLNPSWVKGFKLAGLDTIEVEGEGTIVRDVFGREYLDFSGGYSVFILGHRHPKVVEAARRELERMPMSVRMLPSKTLADLAECLAQATPGDLQHSFICHSGAEAVEAAIKLARVATGRPEIISTVGAYHGKTLGALSASGRELYRTPFEPLVPGFVHVPYGDADAVEKAITERTAAVILEPIQGENGVILPPDDYLPRVREICNRRGVLLILDEVQTGMGRTGRMFACEHSGVVPDIMTLAKGLGGGVAPVGAMIARPHVWKPFGQHPYLHSTTFGNRVGWAAAHATLRVLMEERLYERAAQLGPYLLQKLQAVREEHPDVIADVRGRGFLIGVEFTHGDVALLVMAGMASRRVLAVHTLNKPEVLRIVPPLIVSQEEIDRAVEAFWGAVEEAKGLLQEVAGELGRAD